MCGNRRGCDNWGCAVIWSGCALTWRGAVNLGCRNSGRAIKGVHWPEGTLTGAAGALAEGAAQRGVSSATRSPSIAVPAGAEGRVPPSPDCQGGSGRRVWCLAGGVTCTRPFAPPALTRPPIIPCAHPPLVPRVGLIPHPSCTPLYPSAPTLAPQLPPGPSLLPPPVRALDLPLSPPSLPALAVLRGCQGGGETISRNVISGWRWEALPSPPHHPLRAAASAKSRSLLRESRCPRAAAAPRRSPLPVPGRRVPVGSSRLRGWGGNAPLPARSPGVREPARGAGPAGRCRDGSPRREAVPGSSRWGRERDARAPEPRRGQAGPPPSPRARAGRAPRRGSGGTAPARGPGVRERRALLPGASHRSAFCFKPC